MNQDSYLSSAIGINFSKFRFHILDGSDPFFHGSFDIVGTEFFLGHSVIVSSVNPALISCHKVKRGKSDIIYLAKAW